MMATLNNLLNVYFHMKNHYRRLKNVKSCVNTNLPNSNRSAGRGRRSKLKRECSYQNEICLNLRPPTRRNATHTPPPNKSRHVSDTVAKIMTGSAGVKPMSARIRTANHNNASRFQNVPTDNPAYSSSLMIKCPSIEQQDYLQFSLRITEEIIRNDLYKNEEMVKVLKNHFLANRKRLNEDKLLSTLVELCAELNIPTDENLWLYLHDNGPYIPGKLEVFKSHLGKYGSINEPHCNMQNPTEQHSRMETIDDKDSIKHVLELMSNCMSNCALDLVKVNYESEDSKPERESEITNAERRSQDENPDSLFAKICETANKSSSMEKHPINRTRTDNLVFNEQHQFMQQNNLNNYTIPSSTNRGGPNVSISDASMNQIITVSASSLENRLDMSETVIQTELDYKEIESTFTDDPDSIMTGTGTSNHHPNQTNGEFVSTEGVQTSEARSSCETNEEKTSVTEVKENNGNEQKRELTFSHYYNSIEPKPKKTHELSVQTSREDLLYETQSDKQEEPHNERSEEITTDMIHEELATTIFERQRTGPEFVENGYSIGAKGRKCNNCHEEIQLFVRQAKTGCDSNNLSLMGSSRDSGQYVIYDGPVLIPKEKSMEVIAAQSMRYQFGSNEEPVKNYTTDSGCPYTRLKNYETPCKSNTIQYDRPNPNQNESLLYDLNNKYNVASCCSCKLNEANSLLLTNRYERYKKVNDTLSYFYPTIATQVSSMDLLAVPTHQKVQFNNNNNNKSSMSSKPNSAHRIGSSFMYESNYSAPLSPKIGRSRSNERRGATPQSPVYRQSPIRDNRYNNYSKTTASENDYARSANVINSRGMMSENVIDREIMMAGTKTANGLVTEQHQGRIGSVPLLDTDESMERRINSLRHDIEKYREESLIDVPTRSVKSPKTNAAGPLDENSNLRGDKLSSMQPSTMLPSEMSLPKHKKMAILRKNL